MCVRRRKRKEPDKQPDKIKKKKRRQDTCCYKYGPRAWFRKCSKCICRRFARCLKRKVFGVPNPQVADYEIAGHTMSSYKRMVKSKVPKKSSVKDSTSKDLFKFNESIVPSIDSKLLPPLKFKSTGTVSTLFRNRKSLPVANPSLKDLQLIDGLSAKELKKRYNVTGSNAEVLEELVREYKKGHLSMSGLSKQSKYTEKELNAEKLNKIIKQYKKVRKKSVANIDQIRNMDKEDLKKRFSLSGSKGRVFNQMIDDYRKGKISLSKLTQSKTQPKKFNKDQMNEMLKVYEDSKKDKKVYFPSKFELFRPYIDNVKDNMIDLKDKVSISSLKEKYARLYS